MVDVQVRDVPEESRFVAEVDGAAVGSAAYELAPGAIIFTHTVVDDAVEGQGIGSALVRTAMDAVGHTGQRRVDPQCPFVADWIERHPDYQDLLLRS